MFSVPAQNVNTSSSNIAPIASNTNNVSANISAANPTNVNTNNNTISEPDTVSVDGPTKIPGVSAADDGQPADESERYVSMIYFCCFALYLIYKIDLRIRNRNVDYTGAQKSIHEKYYYGESSTPPTNQHHFLIPT